ESTTTTGIFLFAVSNALTNAVLSTGATTSASTPRVCMSLMIEIWRLISFSSGGPSHLISTPSSFPALSAPAFTDFQNTWLVPLGTTPIVLLEDPLPLLSHPCASARTAQQITTKKRFIIFAISASVKTFGPRCNTGSRPRQVNHPRVKRPAPRTFESAPPRHSDRISPPDRSAKKPPDCGPMPESNASPHWSHSRCPGADVR